MLMRSKQEILSSVRDRDVDEVETGKTLLKKGAGRMEDGMELGKKKSKSIGVPQKGRSSRISIDESLLHKVYCTHHQKKISKEINLCNVTIRSLQMKSTV